MVRAIDANRDRWELHLGQAEFENHLATLMDTNEDRVLRDGEISRAITIGRKLPH